MSTDRPSFWFAAKRYGWGWGLPVRWQGWAVLVAYLVLIYAGRFLFGLGNGGFLLYLVGLTVLLVVVVAAKGERPRWRWGGK